MGNKPRYKMMWDTGDGVDCPKCCSHSDSCYDITCDAGNRKDDRGVYFIKLN